MAGAIAGEHLAGSGIDGHHVAVAQRRRGGAGSDDRREPELAADDRRVARAAARVGDERGGAAHRGDPVRGGHLGDEDVAVGEEVAVRR